MSGCDDRWAAAVSSWADAQGDIEALVQIGSRVQATAESDRWSDYDYHLVTSRPDRYRNGSFCRQIAQCWVSGVQVAFGNAVKVTAVYEEALEADFVILNSLELRVATAAMKWPGTRVIWPRILRRGVDSLRIVAAPGWRVIKGGRAWEERYSRMAPLAIVLSGAEFEALCGEFWTQLVWAAKKAARGEYRASQRALHIHLLENTLRMLQEEARLEGRKSFPLARRAENWLTPAQLRGTASKSEPSAEALFAALEGVADTFMSSSLAVATKRGWGGEVPRALRAWLRELALSSTGKARQ